MRLAIVLPGPSSKAIGGYKIMYEYAKYLSIEHNYKVDIFYDIGIHYNMNILVKIKLYFIGKTTSFFNWFDFGNASINHQVYLNLNMKKLNNYDCIFVTAAPIAKKIQFLNLPVPVFYFIQGYEDWNMSKQELINTYKVSNFHNIVISDWLEQILIENNAKVEKVLANPIDHKNFYMTVPHEDRNPFSISMMYHTEKYKGSEEGIKALDIVKKKFPEFRATLFSVFPQTDNIPEWIDYVHQPSQDELRDIYNENALFLSPSIKEGYGLPPAEAMACGATVIATNSGGVTTFCKHKTTAIVVKSPPDPLEVANTIIELIKDDDLRIKLSYNGIDFIQKFKWKNNVMELDTLIKSISLERNKS